MLVDLFHPPLSRTRPWSGFFGSWAPKVAEAISAQLPDGWFAAPTVHWNIEVDVATFETVGAVAGGDTTLTIPEPTRTIDFGLTTDAIEVRVYRELGDLVLAGAIEFVSPANKDRPENREAFVAKCDAFLRESVGVLVVDVVTSRHANLHSELLDRIGEHDPRESALYTSAYRPMHLEGEPSLSYWYRELRIGEPLPEMLLFLKNGPVVNVPLESTYNQTCVALKMV
jgi:hypothetical protein